MVQKVKIYSKYDTPPRVVCPLEAGSNVDKEAGVYTDINFIVKRYVDSDGTSGFPVRVNYNRPIYGDFSKNYTISDAIDLRANMLYLYEELPENIRSQFKNFNEFLVKIGSSSDEEYARMLSDLDYNTVAQTVKPAPDNSGAVASGSVQSTTTSANNASTDTSVGTTQ
uniref:Internal scaffolding protein n=1 Tax=Dulem virus 89 TaxID=3145800 RepID=A0AAU8B4W2_9VIRU